jgi:hypothetical protein
MLKRKLTKDEFAALSEAMKAFYKADGDNFVLQVETHADDDPGELRRALARERQNAKDEKDRADRLQTQVDGLVADPNRAKDMKTLEDSYKNKIADDKKASDKTIQRLTEQLQKSLVADQALKIAAELAGDNAEVLVPHIEKRLKADLEGDTPITRVIDAKGQLSALSFDELKKEFVDNAKFSGIIIASKGHGGAGDKGTGTSTVLKDKKFAELNDTQRSEFFKSDPEGFKKASADHQREVNEALQQNRKF